MTEQQTVSMGNDAARVLDNAAYKQAMQSLKDSVLAQLDECPIRDHEGRLLLAQLRKLTFKFESVLTGMIASGDFAARKIEMSKERNESKPRQFMRKVING